MADTKKVKLEDGSEVEAQVVKAQPQKGTVVETQADTVCYLFDGKLVCFHG